MIRTVGYRVRALLALLLVLVGCSDVQVPTGARSVPVPSEAPLFSTSEGGVDLAPLAYFEDTPNVTIAWAKKWIGPEGGRLDFLGFAIEVPPGAVDKVTQFSIRLPVDPQAAERVVAEFGPHGAAFAAPVAIELPYAGTTSFESAPAVGWWNPDLGVWEGMETTTTADGLRIRTTTSHFSTYGSLDTFGVGPAVSGG